MKTNRFKTVLALVLCAAILLTMGCGKENERITTRVAALKGPTGMGLAYLMQADSDAYQIELFDAPDAVIGKFINGEIDIAAVPVNLAATLYNKTGGDVVALAVNTLGVLYVLDNTNSVRSLNDLAGKTVYATGQGSTPEYVLNYILEKNGLSDQVKVEYVGEHAALAAMLASGEAEIGMLPEPNVSAVLLKNADAKVALNLTEEWERVAGTALVQGVYVANKTYYAEHRAAAEQFVVDCTSSAERVNTDEGAAKVMAELGILGSEAIAKKAIPNCNIVCITGKQMQTSIDGMLAVLYEANPKSVGGALPGNALYEE